jgi:hypothetical protein
MEALPFCKATLDGVRCPKGPYFAEVRSYPSDPTTIGEAIRKRRLDLGLRQIDVAKLVGCNEMELRVQRSPHPGRQMICDSGYVCRARSSQLEQEFLGLSLCETMVAHNWKDGIGDFGIADYLVELNEMHLVRHYTLILDVWLFLFGAFMVTEGSSRYSALQRTLRFTCSTICT